MKHTQSKNNGTKRHMRMLAILLVPVVALILGVAAPELWADDDDDDDEIEIPFAEAHLFFELNNTDGDLGIHALIDGDAWKRLKIEDPKEREMLNVYVQGRLRRQGLTEIFFESAEPTFDELSPKKFFRRFPEGTYEIEGRTTKGVEMESEVELTHVMPAPVDGITLKGSDDPTPVEVDLEDVDCEEDDSVPSVKGETVTIKWDAVTMSHPDKDGGGAAVQPPIGVMIHNYEVVVEAEVEVDGEEFSSVFSVILPPGAPGETEFSFTIPEEFIALGEEFKYEILAREVSFNQTAVESCFVLE